METGIKGSFLKVMAPFPPLVLSCDLYLCSASTLFAVLSDTCEYQILCGHFLRSFTVLTTWLPCNFK